MIRRIIGFTLLMLVTSSCSTMKPVEFKMVAPRFVLEQYFKGETEASGIFEDRFGTVRRQFVVSIIGTWDGNVLELDESFLYQDGEKDRRIWKITKLNDNQYKGTAADVDGVALGESYGNALNWKYMASIKTRYGSFNVDFDDWMFLQPSGVLINRAKLSKFGIEIGTVTIAFTKSSRGRDGELAGSKKLKDGVLAK